MSDKPKADPRGQQQPKQKDGRALPSPGKGGAGGAGGQQQQKGAAVQQQQQPGKAGAAQPQPQQQKKPPAQAPRGGSSGGVRPRLSPLPAAPTSAASLGQLLVVHNRPSRRALQDASTSDGSSSGDEEEGEGAGQGSKGAAAAAKPADKARDTRASHLLKDPSHSLFSRGSTAAAELPR